MIRVADVRKSFKSGDEEIEALRGVSFEVPRGRLFVFFRATRIGKKSTLLYLLGALTARALERSSSTVTISPA